jgi:carbamate kinase
MRIVIALGGNALGATPQEQKDLVTHTAKSVIDIIAEGHEVIISHGNGPQVGMINTAMEKENMPFPECGAMSQGYIGYHLQNAIKNELRKKNIDRHVVSLVTQVVVDENDPGFEDPTKPIGSFMSEKEAVKLKNDKGFSFVEDSGRGYRRVVASPKPVDIVEKQIIREVVDAKHIVIASGGGGIPVIDKGGAYEGVPAVIDKDFASSKLADIVDADMLCILTAVDHVSLHFNTPEQKDLGRISSETLRKYVNEGHFAKGSMLPKVEAALMFVENNAHHTAVIASLENAYDAIYGRMGTIITNKEDKS